MKYALFLFALAAACLVGLVLTPYVPGEPQVVRRVVEEVVYVGSNFSVKMILFLLAGAAGLGGLIALLVAIDADRSLRLEQIRAQQRGR